MYALEYLRRERKVNNMFYRAVKLLQSYKTRSYE
jgi:hypothetical protein